MFLQHRGAQTDICMHDAHLGRVLLPLDILAEYIRILLSMTVMVTPCLKYVVGMRLVMSYAKFPRAPFARAPFGECRSNSTWNECYTNERKSRASHRSATNAGPMKSNFCVLGGDMRAIERWLFESQR